MQHSTRRIWNALQPSLTEAEQETIVRRVEAEGEDFDSIVLDVLRRGLFAPRFCPSCGEPLPRPHFKERENTMVTITAPTATKSAGACKGAPRTLGALCRHPCRSPRCPCPTTSASPSTWPPTPRWAASALQMGLGRAARAGASASPTTTPCTSPSAGAWPATLRVRAGDYELEALAEHPDRWTRLATAACALDPAPVQSSTLLQ